MSVSNLKIHVKRGRIYSLLGRNGAGKTILISSHILSEISLLADDIGIIDRGILLEEENLKELKKNAKFIHFIVSDAKKVTQFIGNLFQTRNMQIADNYHLHLYGTSLPVE